jgi:small-conductance mechanosensitive channel
MNELKDTFHELLTPERILAGVRALVLLGAGLLAARYLSRLIARLLAHVQSPQQNALTRRVASYGFVLLTAMVVLKELGFNLTTLLGAAGIVTVAVGFAAQTSASNVISGLFLVGERSIQVGAVIRVGTTTGEVIAVDAMSVKLRTFDNLLVRIPNETMIKSEITTLNHFPIRRIDVQLRGHYADRLDELRDVLIAVADAHPTCLEEPRPLFMVTGFGEDGMTIQFSVWASTDAFLDTRTSLHEDIKVALEDAGLTIPYPQRDLHLVAAADGLALAATPSDAGARA